MCDGKTDGRDCLRSYPTTIQYFHIIIFVFCALIIDTHRIRVYFHEKRRSYCIVVSVGVYFHTVVNCVRYTLILWRQPKLFILWISRLVRKYIFKNMYPLRVVRTMVVGTMRQRNTIYQSTSFIVRYLRRDTIVDLLQVKMSFFELLAQIPGTRYSASLVCRLKWISWKTLRVFSLCILISRCVFAPSRQWINALEHTECGGKMRKNKIQRKITRECKWIKLDVKLNDDYW